MAGTLHRETIHLVSCGELTRKATSDGANVHGQLAMSGGAQVEFLWVFHIFFCKCRSGSWGFLRYLEIPEEERTHIWFNQKQVQKTKHHCSGTVVADTSWPSPATASARAKGLFESANVSYLDMTMENHHFFKGKASINRLFSIARVSSPDLPSLSFLETAGLELPHPLSWKQNHVIQLYSYYFSYILVISLIHLIDIHICKLFIYLFIHLLIYLFIIVYIILYTSKIIYRMLSNKLYISYKLVVQWVPA